MVSIRVQALLDQLRAQGIQDEQVLNALAAVPREKFVDEAFEQKAWDNIALPIGQGQTISQPYMVARMTELLELTPQSRVLEIGTGSGYSAALLSKLAKEVVTLELNAELAEMARENLADAGCDNVSVRVADGSKDVLPEGPFDVIMLSGSVESIPEELPPHLKDGGRLSAIVGNEPVMRFTVVTKQGGSIVTKTPWDIVAPRLHGFNTTNRFKF